MDEGLSQTQNSGNLWLQEVCADSNLLLGRQIILPLSNTLSQLVIFN